MIKIKIIRPYWNCSQLFKYYKQLIIKINQKSLIITNYCLRTMLNKIIKINKFNNFIKNIKYIKININKGIKKL